MKQILYFLSVICLLAGYGCGLQKETVSEEKPPKEEVICEKSLVDVAEYREAKEDPYKLLGARLEGDCLAIDVSYGGGCEGAYFKLIGQETQTKMPPPIYLYRLAFDDQDYCRSIVRKTLRFDVGYLRETGNKVVQLQLKGWDENFEIKGN